MGTKGDRGVEGLAERVGLKEVLEANGRSGGGDRKRCVKDEASWVGTKGKIVGSERESEATTNYGSCYFCSSFSTSIW